MSANQIIHTISEPGQVKIIPSAGFALFNYGFRPFFLFGSIFGLFALGYFILWISGLVTAWNSSWDAVIWHQHEMLFGFTAAIIAGFLFTAVPNWTGHPTPKGRLLTMIVLLWFVGRVMVFYSAHLPDLLVGLIDVLFPIACMGGILPALIKSRNRRNYVFIALLALLAFANGITHWGDTDRGILLARDIALFMIVVIGGRVIPFFTERPLGISIMRSRCIEYFTVASTLAAFTLEVAEANNFVMGGSFLLAAIANGLRLGQWQSMKTLRVPLLWVLHAGYVWLMLGLALKSTHYFGFDVSSSVATHALTSGCIGGLTLGMMARVSLGHSGRILAVNNMMIFSFICINLATVARVFGIWLFPHSSVLLLELAAALWILAFGIFVFVYAPILIRPRADGREG